MITIWSFIERRKNMTGKEFRKELKRVFKKYGLDDKDLDIVGLYLMTFFANEESYEKQLERIEGIQERCDFIEKYHQREHYRLRYDEELDKLYLELIDRKKNRLD